MCIADVTEISVSGLIIVNTLRVLLVFLCKQMKHTSVLALIHLTKFTYKEVHAIFNMLEGYSNSQQWNSYYNDTGQPSGLTEMS